MANGRAYERYESLLGEILKSAECLIQGAMRHSGIDGAAVVPYGDTFAVVSGDRQGRWSGSVLIYRPENDTWTVLPSTHPRHQERTEAVAIPFAPSDYQLATCN